MGVRIVGVEDSSHPGHVRVSSEPTASEQYGQWKARRSATRAASTLANYDFRLGVFEELFGKAYKMRGLTPAEADFFAVWLSGRPVNVEQDVPPDFDATGIEPGQRLESRPGRTVLVQQRQRVQAVEVDAEWFDDPDLRQQLCPLSEPTPCNEDTVSVLVPAGYCKETAAGIISFVRNLWDDLARTDDRGPVHHNPWATVEALPPLGVYSADGRLEERSPQIPFAWGEIVAIVALLKRHLLLPFWLMAACGLRLGEVLGLRIGDWNSETAILSIEEQRLSPKKGGRKKPKTPAGRREFQVPRQVAQLLDASIAVNHSPSPSGRNEIRKWRNQLLVLGANGRPLERTVLYRELNRIYKTLGLTYDRLGFYPMTTHHLRKTIASALQMIPWLAPHAISIWLGHDLGSTAALWTRTTYGLPIHRELRKIAIAIENLIDEHVGDIEGKLNADAVNLDEAAAAIGCDRDEVLLLVRDGVLRPVVLADGERRPDLQLLLERGSVVAEAASRAAEARESVPIRDVMNRLHLDYDHALAMIEHGWVDPVTNEIFRLSAINPRGGQGRRSTGVDASDVERLALHWSDRIKKIETHLTTGEAAEQWGVRPTTVRGWCETPGEVEHWTDPVSGRRYFSVDEVERVARRRARVSVSEAARQLSASVVSTRATIKMRGLRSARHGEVITQGELDVEAERQRQVFSLVETVELIAGLLDAGALQPEMIRGRWQISADSLTAVLTPETAASPVSSPPARQKATISACDAAEALGVEERVIAEWIVLNELEGEFEQSGWRVSKASLAAAVRARRVDGAPKGYVSVAEAAELLGRSTRTVLQMIADGELDAVVLGGQRFIAESSAHRAVIMRGIPDGYVTVEQAVARLGVGPAMISTLCSSGRLESQTNRAGRVVISNHSLENEAERRSQSKLGPPGYLPIAMAARFLDTSVPALHALRNRGRLSIVVVDRRAWVSEESLAEEAARRRERAAAGLGRVGRPPKIAERKYSCQSQVGADSSGGDQKEEPRRATA